MTNHRITEDTFNIYITQDLLEYISLGRSVEKENHSPKSRVGEYVNRHLTNKVIKQPKNTRESTQHS